MDISLKYRGLILLIFSLVLIQSCAEENPLEPELGLPDTNSPSVFIETPTTDIFYVTTESSISLEGVAADDVELKEIGWSNSAGGNGIAPGLGNWSTGNIPLVIGDNTVTVTASDMAGNTSTDEIMITHNEYLNFVGRSYIDPDGMFVNTPTDVTIRVTIAPNPNLIQSSVKLLELDANNSIIQELAQMFDDGDLNHGDDILGDGVFSTIVTMTEIQAGEIKLRVSAETQEAVGNVEGFSAIFLFNVFEHILSQDDDVLKETVDSALVRLKEFYENQNNTLGESITSTVEWLKTLPDVQDAFLSGGQLLEIEFNSGLLAGISFMEVDEQGRVITQGSSLIPDSTRRTLQKRIPRSQQTFGFRKPGLEKTGMAEDDIILNKKILIYEPFANIFWPPDKGSAAKEILESSDIPFEITHLKNQEATVEALFNLTDYGFIIIDTHGSRGESFTSGEFVNDATRAKYEILRRGRQPRIFPNLYAKVDPILHTLSWGTKSYWDVHSSFIEGLNGTFPKSVIFNSSCESTEAEHVSWSLKSVFFNKGAKTYLGVSAISTTGFLKECLLDFSGKFGRDLKNTGESFTPGRVDRNAGYEIYGSKEMHYSTSMINGDFEYGDLTGWSTFGDARNISQLSYLSPPGGNHMAIISTGLGGPTDVGTIAQSFLVGANQSTISLKWNFLSEEFLEFIGSQFQDAFGIDIITSNGEFHQIFFRNVDQIANEFSATTGDPGLLVYVSPNIVFDQGDVYMTDWQMLDLDISQYRNQYITLKISAGDVGDSNFDTAILLDNITIQ